MINKNEVLAKVNENTHVVDVLSAEHLIKMWEKAKGKNFLQTFGKAARQSANYAAAAMDVATAVRLIKDLGFNGRVILKTVNGKQYVIFKGYAGHRSIFTGTRYLATNPKVVDMAIGKFGVNRVIVSGARLTIYLVVPINILNYVLSDQQTMTQLIGSTATDLAKVGIAAAVASLAASATAAVTTLVAAPLVVAIVVGVATALALDALDRQFGVTDALVKGLDELYDSTFGEIGRMKQQAEEALQEHILTDGGLGGLTDALEPDFEREDPY